MPPDCPRDLKEALSVIPFLHLVPQQDLAPLLTSTNIDPISTEEAGGLASEAAINAENDLNNHPEKYKEVIDSITKDFTSFNSSELDEITFKRPIIARDTSRVQNVETLELPLLQRKLYDEMEDIEDSCLHRLEVESKEVKQTEPLELINGQLKKRKRRKSLEEEGEEGKTGKRSEDQKRRKSEELREEKQHEEEEGVQVLDGKDHSSEEPKELTVVKRQKSIDKDQIVRQAYKEFIQFVEETGILDGSIDPTFTFTTSKGNIVLKSTTLMTILDHLFRIHKHAIIEEIDVEYLIAVQKLCWKSLETGKDSHWNEMPKSSNLQSFASNLLLVSRVSLLIFNSNKRDKRLKVVAYYDAVLEFTASLLQDGILPSVDQGKYSFLLDEIALVFLLMLESLNGEEFNEQLLTKLEYLTIKIIFFKGPNSSLESLSLASSLVLVSIYKNYPNQRPFILNEVLSNFDKLSHLKSMTHQTKLSRGGSVQLFTLLLVRLTQSCNTVQFENDAKEARKSKTGSKRGQSKIRKFLDSSTYSLMGAVHVANDIANFFAAKLKSSSDANFKSSFLLFLEDLSTMLILPEWPGVEIIVSSIMKLFLRIVQKDEAASPVESFCFEMAGKIGRKLLEVRMMNQNIAPLSLKSTPEEFENLHSWVIDTLQYVKLLSYRSKEYHSAFKFLLLKYSDQMSQIMNQKEEYNDEHEIDTRSTKHAMKGIIIDLIRLASEDSIQFSQAVSSDKDSLSINSYVSILLSDNLIPIYDSFINTILQNLNSSKVKIKTRAVRILSALVEQNSNLLLTSTIQKSICKSFLDPSALVRDAVIDLFGSYMLLKIEYIDHFYKPVCERLNDDSVLVRKRVLKLSKEMYMKTQKQGIKVYVASQLLKRLDDEENSISSMARQVVNEIWFPIGASYKEVSLIAEVMMKVVSSGSKNNRNFFNAMNDLIFNKESDVVPMVKRINAYVLDTVVDGETDLEERLMLVSALVKCDATLLTQDQLFSLQPMLVDYKNTTTCFYCLQIFKNTLPHFSALRPEFSESTQRFLLQNLTKFDVKELHEAMPSAWILCRVNNSIQKLSNAAISCIKLLKPFIVLFNKAPGKPDPKLIRLLHLLGCFGSYCNFEAYRDQFINVGLRDNETITSLVAKLLVFFCNSKFDEQVRGVAVKNLISLCTYHAKLFISDSILKVLDREFEGRSVAIKHTIIQGIIGFLSKEDNDSQARNGMEEKSSSKIKLDVAVFHGDAKSYYNDGICAGIVQRYTTKILDLCLIDSGQESLLPVQFLYLVVRLGFANPKICMPTIIGLESSSNRQIRRIALDLHRDIFDKHESLSDSSYVDGMKSALRLKNTISGCNSFLGSKHLLSIYDIVKRSYSSRKKFITAIIKIFDIDLAPKRIKEAIDQRNLILYCIANLLEIMFSSFEEVLMIAHQLDKTIARQGIDLCEGLPNKAKPPKTKLEYQFDFINCQAMIAIVNYRVNLTSSYNITDTQLELYRPNKADIETRQPPKVATIIPFSFNDLALSVPLSQEDKFIAVYARLRHRIRELT